MRVAATMIVPGIRSPVTSTMIPKTSAAARPTVRNAV
jgi:hypothetical protein